MEESESQTLEMIMRKLLTPIINEAVDKAIARHHIAIAPPVQAPIEILDIKKTAEFLLLTVPTIYGLVQKRTIPYYKQGKRLYFRKDELQKWITGSRRMTIYEISQAAEQSMERTRIKY